MQVLIVEDERMLADAVVVDLRRAAMGWMLSIVKSMTRAHGGTVTAVPCLGGGL